MQKDIRATSDCVTAIHLKYCNSLDMQHPMFSWENSYDSCFSDCNSAFRLLETNQPGYCPKQVGNGPTHLLSDCWWTIFIPQVCCIQIYLTTCWHKKLSNHVISVVVENQYNEMFVVWIYATGFDLLTAFKIHLFPSHQVSTIISPSIICFWKQSMQWYVWKHD